MKNLVSKGFKGFKMHHDLYHYPRRQEKTLLKQSEVHFCRALRAKIFQGWEAWVLGVAKPKRESNLQAQMFRRRSILRANFSMFANYQKVDVFLKIFF